MTTKETIIQPLRLTTSFALLRTPAHLLRKLYEFPRQTHRRNLLEDRLVNTEDDISVTDTVKTKLGLELGIVEAWKLDIQLAEEVSDGRVLNVVVESKVDNVGLDLNERSLRLDFDVAFTSKSTRSQTIGEVDMNVDIGDDGILGKRQFTINRKAESPVLTLEVDGLGEALAGARSNFRQLGGFW